jgi:hypothetical protein
MPEIGGSSSFGGETIDTLRESGKRFTIETLVEIMSRDVGGREFDFSKVCDSVYAELEHQSLKAELGPDDIYFYFEPDHPLNKYSLLRPKTLRERIMKGEVRVEGHRR